MRTLQQCINETMAYRKSMGMSCTEDQVRREIEVMNFVKREDVCLRPDLTESVERFPEVYFSSHTHNGCDVITGWFEHRHIERPVERPVSDDEEYFCREWRTALAIIAEHS